MYDDLRYRYHKLCHHHCRHHLYISTKYWCDVNKTSQHYAIFLKCASHWLFTLALPVFLCRSFTSLLLSRHQRTSSTHVLDAVWQLTYWESATGIMTTSCCAPLVTCFISTSANSWATPRCLAASKGENQTCWRMFMCIYVCKWLSDEICFRALRV